MNRKAEKNVGDSKEQADKITADIENNKKKQNILVQLQYELIIELVRF